MRNHYVIVRIFSSDSGFQCWHTARPHGPGPRATRVHGEVRQMSALTQTQVRCTGCNRRLADVINEVRSGQAIFEMKCPRCGLPHLEIIRPLRDDRAAAEPA